MAATETDAEAIEVQRVDTARALIGSVLSAALLMTRGINDRSSSDGLEQITIVDEEIDTQSEGNKNETNVPVVVEVEAPTSGAAALLEAEEQRQKEEEQVQEKLTRRRMQKAHKLVSSVTEKAVQYRAQLRVDDERQLFERDLEAQRVQMVSQLTTTLLTNALGVRAVEALQRVGRGFNSRRRLHTERAHRLEVQRQSDKLRQMTYRGTIAALGNALTLCHRRRKVMQRTVLPPLVASAARRRVPPLSMMTPKTQSPSKQGTPPATMGSQMEEPTTSAASPSPSRSPLPDLPSLRPSPADRMMTSAATPSPHFRRTGDSLPSSSPPSRVSNTRSRSRQSLNEAMYALRNHNYSRRSSSTGPSPSSSLETASTGEGYRQRSRGAPSPLLALATEVLAERKDMSRRRLPVLPPLVKATDRLKPFAHLFEGDDGSGLRTEQDDSSVAESM